MDNELEYICGQKGLWLHLEYCPSVCLEGLRGTMKYLNQDS